jgi:CrcB protein
MNAALIVFLGAGFGGAMRHGVNVAIVSLLGPNVPWGTLVVNVSGSLVLGILAGLFALKSDPGQAWRLFATTGVLGGFTTFSAFSMDTAVLIQRGAHPMALGYVLASVAGSVLAVFIGLFLARQF